MTINTEGGMRPSRIEYVPEEGNQGVTPQDPNFQFPSDRMTLFEPELGPEEVEKFALGQVDASVEQGLEESEVTLGYDMQQWFTDANGDPNDLAAYGMMRVAGILPDSLTIVERMQSGDMEEGVFVRPESTVEYWYNDTDPTDIEPKEARVYTVLKGADVSEVNIHGDIEEVDWANELELACEEGRSYQIDQPREDTSLAVRSTNADDTGLTVRVESEADEDTGDFDFEELELDETDATDLVGGTQEFGDIDAVEVYDEDGNVADHLGDILLFENDGDETEPEAADLLTVLYGRSFYRNTHGDPGIPCLGDTGSRADPIETDFYKAANVSVERPEGKLFEAAGSVQELEITIENEIERTPQQRSRSGRQHHGARIAELEVTADGETLSHQRLVERMSGEPLDTIIRFDQAGDEYVNLRNAVVSESSRSREAGEPGEEQEFTLRATHPGVDISQPAA